MRSVPTLASRCTCPSAMSVFLPKTRYQLDEPTDKFAELPFEEDTLASTAATCQAKCAKVEGCVFFSFWLDTGRCHLLGGSGTTAAPAAFLDKEATAGPRACGTAPPPPWGEEDGAAGDNAAARIWESLDRSGVGFGMPRQMGPAPRPWLVLGIL